MGNKFEIKARRGFQSITVGYYDTFKEAIDAMEQMQYQHGALGFHMGYGILYNDEPVFLAECYDKTPEKIVEELDSFGKLEGKTDEEKLAYVKAGMESGKIIATGEYLGVID